MEAVCSFYETSHHHISEDTAFHYMNVSDLRSLSLMTMDPISLMYRIFIILAMPLILKKSLVLIKLKHTFMYIITQKLGKIFRCLHVVFTFTWTSSNGQYNAKLSVLYVLIMFSS
jgi:hypothetical protein